VFKHCEEEFEKVLEMNKQKWFVIPFN